MDFPIGYDEDIPTPTPAAAKDTSNDVRIGPMTRARAKLLEQQVNSLLAEPDIFINENFILPKLMYLCMIRFTEETSFPRGGGGLRHEEAAMHIDDCAREEQEDDAHRQ
jgi:hypothetical protein